MRAAASSPRRASPRASPWAAEARATAALAWPIVLTNLSQIALTATDTAFLGRLSDEALAAATIGAALWWAAMAPGFGVAFASAAMLAQERGRGGRGWVRGSRRTVRVAFQALLPASAPPLLALWYAEPILLALGQEARLAALAADYLRAMAFGMVPFFGFLVLRGFLAALERPRPALVVAFAAIGLNALLDWLLVFGNAGAPALGVVGAGVASAVSNTAMLLGLGAVCLLDRRLRRFRLAGRFWRHDAARLRELGHLGTPIAAQMLLETGLFGAVGLVMGGFGAEAVAAHAVALQVASTTFMVPMGLGQAATARVGLATGAGDAAGARRAGWVALGLGAAFMAGAAALMIALPAPLAAAFLGERPPGDLVVALSAALLFWAGTFQLTDGVQVVAAGALRGLKDTRVPLLCAAVGYWGLGLPLAWALAVPLGLGPPGVWMGLTAGLLLVAALLTERWRRLSSRPPLADVATAAATSTPGARPATLPA